MLNILSVGKLLKPSNTAFHRSLALEKIANKIDHVNTETSSFYYKLINKLFNIGCFLNLPDILNVNTEIKNLVSRNNYNIVWIDKGLTVNPSTLKFIKKRLPECKIISFSADNMTLRHNQSNNFLNCFKFYDIHVTTKSNTVDLMYKMGAQKVLFTNNSFESSYHYPRNLSDKELKKFGADIGFIGVWEKERFESILFLAKKGLKIKVFGQGKWKNFIRYHPNLEIVAEALFSEDYCKAIKAFKISLCFLRKLNNDLQTTRTMEIPACGGFMLAERTKEHLALFEENKEAVFFSDNDELYDKCRYFLENDKERDEIAFNGFKKTCSSGYSNYETIKRIINKALKP